jgi:importin-7
VQSGDPLRMHNALLALRQVSKRLEYKSGNNREPLEVIINSALPLAQQLVRSLIESDNNSLEAALIMKLCFKILWYKRCAYMCICLLVNGNGFVIVPICL